VGAKFFVGGRTHTRLGRRLRLEAAVVRWVSVAVVAILHSACASTSGPGGATTSAAARAPDAGPPTSSPSRPVDRRVFRGVFGRELRPPRADKPWVRGSAEAARIYRVIGSHLAEVRSCYEQGLLVSSDLTGRVSVEFVIGPNGRVLNAGLQESTLQNPPVEDCILRAVRTWNFPSPDGGGIVAVGYPFNFLPSR
jgi:TonB family protein